MNVSELKAKLEKHQAYYDAKFSEYVQIDKSATRSLKRNSRLLTLSNLITALIMELNTEMMIAAFKDGSEELVNSIFEECKKTKIEGGRKGGLSKEDEKFTSAEAKLKPSHSSSRILAEGEIL